MSTASEIPIVLDVSLFNKGQAFAAVEQVSSSVWTINLFDRHRSMTPTLAFSLRSMFLGLAFRNPWLFDMLLVAIPEGQWSLMA